MKAHGRGRRRSHRGRRGRRLHVPEPEDRGAV